jgi:CRP-like cAMP-binding protein
MNAPRPQALVDSPALAARAAELLRGASSLLPLSDDEAAAIVALMLLIHYPPKSTVLREGDNNSRSNYLLLLLDGQVAVDARSDGPHDAVAVAVLGPGSIIGEMALLDGAPRSATCTALSAVQAAGLSRKSLERLVEEQPRAAAKLMVGLANGISDRLRALSDQLNLYAQLTTQLQAEVDRLRAPS